MKFSYIVRSIEGHFKKYETDRLYKAKQFIEKQDEPMMYEIIKEPGGKVIF